MRDGRLHARAIAPRSTRSALPDPSFFLFSEEVDWLYRFAAAGWKTVFTPDAQCMHVGGASHGGRLYRDNLRGHMRFFLKHHGLAQAESVRSLLRTRNRHPRQDRPRREGGDVPRRRPLARNGRRALADRAMSSVFLLIRLAIATGLVLAPGAIVARAIGVRSTSATLAWGLGIVFAAMTVVFAVHASLTLALVLLLVVALVAAPFAVRRPMVPAIPGRKLVWVAGIVLGLLLWHVAGEIGGDGLFHLARARKLLEFGDLRLSSVNEFADGGLHPGYAFPLWQAFLALIAKVAFVDPSKVVLHEASVLAPLAVLAAYEAGYGLFRRVVPAAASAGAAVGIAAMAAGHGGSFTSLALPATSSRQLLVPAALALAFAALRDPTKALLASVGVASLVLAVVHPTYAIFLWIPFAGFLAVRWAWRCEKFGSGSLTLAALVVPAGLFLAWLLPVVRKTASVSPDAHERARGFEHYAGQLNGSADQFWVAPQVFGRSGAIAVAALLLIPFAVFASRRRWAAYVVGGSLAVFAITLVPWLFTPFSDVVSLSQSRRLAGFIPFSFALAGGMGVLAALLGRFVVPLALVAGIVLQWQYPGDFGYALQNGGPAWATWIAVVGALVALVVGLWRLRSLETTAALASALRAAPDLRLRALPLVAVAGADGAAAHPGSRSRSCGPSSRRRTSSTRIRSRATRSPPPRPSTSASRLRVTWPTRCRTALRAARPVASTSTRAATSGSRSAAVRGGS